MKRIFRGIALAVLILIVAAPAVLADGLLDAGKVDGWTIEGDKVFLDNPDIYLSATPHTLAGSGWVEFELQSKGYEGEIDFLLGFDGASGVEPVDPQIWSDNVPHLVETWVDREVSTERVFYDVATCKPLTKGAESADIGIDSNSQLVRVTGADRGEDYSLVVACESYELDKGKLTVQFKDLQRVKETTTEYYPDFRPFDTTEFNGTPYDYLGVNDWSFVQLDTNIKAGVTYRIRCWLEIPFTGTDKVISKYVWGIKPSGQTIQQSEASGTLYLLDPWLTGGWDQRIELTIDSGDIDADLANFPVLVYLSDASGRDATDVTCVFNELVADVNRLKIAVTTSDEETQCYVEIEKWDDANEQAWLWVGVPAISSLTDTILYIYYDVDHADNVAYVGDINSAQAEAVWDANFRGVYHMADGLDNASVYDSTQYDMDGVKSGANQPLQVDGGIGWAQDFDGIANEIGIANVVAINPDITAEVVFNPPNNPITFSGILGKRTAWDDFYLLQLIASNNIEARWVNSVGGIFDCPGGVVTPAVYNYFSFRKDGDNLYLRKDGAQVGTIGCNGVANNIQPYYIGHSGNRNFYIDGLIDEVRFSDSARSNSWLAATHESNTDDLIAFGAEDVLEVPTVETNNAGVDGVDVTMNGDITDTGNPPGCDTRGFVWDTATHADPGDTDPGVSAYSDYSTEAGDFGVGDFDYLAEGLTPLTTYYIRAWAHNFAGYAYGMEITFFVTEAGKVYLELRPDLDETLIRGQAGIPTDAAVGEFNGYSLPVVGADEELHFIVCVPDRWDGESDILIHIDSCLSLGNQADRSNRWQLEWEHFTPNEDIVPGTNNVVLLERYFYSNDQYQSYQDWMVIDYDIDVGDAIYADDLIGFTIRRVTTAPKGTDADEIIVFAIDVLFKRGDLLGDPEGGVEDIVDDLIDDGTLVGGAQVEMFALAFIAVMLTVAMYVTKESMLGFACAIFWAILGGYAYSESTTPWGDWQYFLAFASLFGMVTFTALAAYGLREKRDSIGDEEMENGDGDYPDEGKGKDDLTHYSGKEGGATESRRVTALHERARKRRERS